MAVTPSVEHVGRPAAPVLVWRLDPPMRTVASASCGGGLGSREWILNAQVPSDYSRVDLAAHVDELAAELACIGPGVALLTAAPVERFTTADDGGVTVHATVGLDHPTWAAAPDDARDGVTPVGTVNVVAFLPVALDDAALVNAVMTVTEAKSQALAEAGVPGTGTASDAVCVAAPAAGRAEAFGGPRSTVGACLARAVHRAIANGITPR
jgi:adenosylcobinamide amidohydrolase